MCLCTCACAHVCLRACVCLHACVCVHLRVSACASACLHARVCMREHMSACVCVYACMCECIFMPVCLLVCIHDFCGSSSPNYIVKPCSVVFMCVSRQKDYRSLMVEILHRLVENITTKSDIYCWYVII